jgi:transcription termination factor Rho
MNFSELASKTRWELMEIARGKGIGSISASRKQELILLILGAEAKEQGYSLGEGILDITPDGYGFLRQNSFSAGLRDIYVSSSQVKRLNLRPGDYILGHIRPPREGEKYSNLSKVLVVNGTDFAQVESRPTFESLTPIFPQKLIDLETDCHNLSTRLMNLVSPIGRGQRGLIVSPPKAGKTILLKQIANAVGQNYDDIHILVCLIGERPEEVTDIKKSIKGEVVSATFDEPPETQTRAAVLALERVKRLAEMGKDVIVLLDGITRLTRAYNLALPSSGKTLSGGIDPQALYFPKKFFGAARNLEEGGSITIIATCLIDTGSRMDDVIYEEFKGTGNMEVHLDRKLSEKRIFPAIDIQRSGTRREELLIPSESLRQIWLLRRMVSLTEDKGNSTEVTERILDRLRKTKDNAEFLATLSREI